MTWQNQQGDSAPSEDSDQPGHPPSLIRVFAVRMKKAWVLSYPLSAQRRLWSDWADAQADLSLRWAHSHFIGFVMSRLNSKYCSTHLFESTGIIYYCSIFLLVWYLSCYIYSQYHSVYHFVFFIFNFYLLNALPSIYAHGIPPTTVSLYYYRNCKGICCQIYNWAASWQNQQSECAPSEDSDQTGHPVSLLSAWRKFGPLAIHWAHSEDSDQTGRMPRLIWVFAGRTATLLVLSRGGSIIFCLLVFNYDCNYFRVYGHLTILYVHNVIIVA